MGYEAKKTEQEGIQPHPARELETRNQ